MLTMLQVALGTVPQSPYSLHLEDDQIMSLELNLRVETLLVFPEDIRLLSGLGLTDGSVEGSVLYQMGEVPNVLHLRPLEEAFDVLMNVMIDEGVYVYRLKPSNTPATVIRMTHTLEEPLSMGNATLITPEMAKELVSEPMYSRQEELMRLFKEERFLRPKLPELYQNYESEIVMKEFVQKHFKFFISHVGRFADDDALLVSGYVLSSKDLETEFSLEKIGLRIGGYRNVAFTNIRPRSALLNADKSVHFTGLLIGNGKGEPGYYSLDNTFRLYLKK